MKRLLALCALVLLAGAVQASVVSAPFCWDKTDKLIVKLKTLDLTTDQLKDVFQYQKAHRDLMAACHQDGRGCGVHEAAEIEFQKASIGVLTDEQFVKLEKRARNETEQLRYENYLLKKEIARLSAKLAELEAKQAAGGTR